jgi:hypothetical protein
MVKGVTPGWRRTPTPALAGTERTRITASRAAPPGTLALFRRTSPQARVDSKFVAAPGRA